MNPKKPEKIFKFFKAKGKIFRFTYDLNPLTNDYEPHIWIRHTVEPVDAIEAWFSITYEAYNTQYRRYEAYSQKFDLEIFYEFTENKNIILIFSACTPRR